MQAARGSEVALPAARFTPRTKPDPVQREGMRKTGGGLGGSRLETVNFAKRPPSGKAARKQPFGYLTGAFTGGGKGSA
jgi:hypothetical protein